MNNRASLSRLRSMWRRFRDDRSGQVLPLVAVMMIVLLGFTGYVTDLGRCYMTYRQLQESCDAAALAGASALASNTAVSVATTFSSTAGGKNARSNLPNVTFVAGYPKTYCATSLSAKGILCTAPSSANAVIVKQQITIPLYFMSLLGKKTQTIAASATAAKAGSMPKPYNVAIVLDTTLSMTFYDAGCGATQISCALAGIRQLLQALSPCAPGDATCPISNGNSTDSVDRVSIFTFPQYTADSAGTDYACGSSPVATQYNFPKSDASAYSISDPTYYAPAGGTYQLTKFHSDFKTSDAASSLNSASALTAASGGISSCNGVGPPKNAGNFGTYYAPSIYAAQSALLAEQAANPGSQNILIILSDGDATAPQTNPPGVDPGLCKKVQSANPPQCILVFGDGANAGAHYPSYNGECGQGVTAAKAAAAAGTRVYTVAYGSSTAGCASDVNTGDYPNITPCQAMEYMASSPEYFFSDNSAIGGSCYTSAQPVSTLNDIFNAIAGGLSVSRIVPDNTP